MQRGLIRGTTVIQRQNAVETTLRKSDHSMSAFTMHSRNYTAGRRNELEEREAFLKQVVWKRNLKDKAVFFKKHSSRKLKAHLEERGKEPLFLFSPGCMLTVNFIATVGEFSLMNAWKQLRRRTRNYCLRVLNDLDASAWLKPRNLWAVTYLCQ